MTDVDSLLSGGVFGATRSDEFDELRELVDDLGRRSFAARRGRRRRPEVIDVDLWDALQHTGLDRLTSIQDNGAGPAEMAVVLYGLARHGAAIPLAETDLLAAWLASSAEVGTPDSGMLTAARAQAVIRDGVAVGTAEKVPWMRAVCALVLLVECGDTRYVAVVDAERASITEAMNLAGEPRDDVAFRIPVADLTPIESSMASEFECRGAWARCVQTVGALDAAAELSVAHCRERVQFGRPLSRIQSVQQTLAAMAGEIERARAATTLAVAAAVEYGFNSGHTEFAVAVAKSVLGPVAAMVTGAAHQLHGAIGTSIEHPLWSCTLRARSWTDEFGTATYHARRVGRLALTSSNVWDCVVGRV
jgi:acyl-CoA dehydrogenase